MNALLRAAAGMAASMEGSPVRKRVVSIFKKFDPDNTGSISRSDLEKVLQVIGVSEPDAKMLMSLFAIGSLAQVDYADFVDWFSQDSAAPRPRTGYDANGGGVGARSLKLPPLPARSAPARSLKVQVVNMSGIRVYEGVVTEGCLTARELKMKIEASVGARWQEQKLLLGTQLLENEKQLLGPGGSLSHSVEAVVELGLVVATNFEVQPLVATTSSIRGVFDEYIARVDPVLQATCGPWHMLQERMDEEGPGALEWFWLLSGGDVSSPPGNAGNADGLVAFKVKQGVTAIGEIVHLSVVDVSTLPQAVEVVKARMFTWLPIASIRATLWYIDLGGTAALDKDIMERFKQSRFRWFTLFNLCLSRAVIMNCSRVVAPVDEPPLPDITYDPPKPEEEVQLRATLGQLWYRGATKAALHPASKAGARNLLVASACLRHMIGDGGDTASLDVSVKEAARGGLVKALLSGEFGRLLAKRLPTPIHKPQEAGGTEDPSVAMASHLIRSLRASPAMLPGLICSGSADTASLVKQCCSHEGYSQALAGLGLESLADTAAALAPADAAFGRFFSMLYWQSVSSMDADSFEVPVHGLADCAGHSHPIFYVPTSEDDTFAVIIPWENMASLPSPESAFAACAHLLRTATPAERPPYAALRLPRLEVRQAAETSAIAKADALSMPANTALHVSELSALKLSPGREMRGRLRKPRPAVRHATFTVRRPFVFCLSHSDIDSREDLNVPLFAMLVT